MERAEFISLVRSFLSQLLSLSLTARPLAQAPLDQLPGHHIAFPSCPTSGPSSKQIMRGVHWPLRSDYFSFINLSSRLIQIHKIQMGKKWLYNGFQNSDGHVIHILRLWVSKYLDVIYEFGFGFVYSDYIRLCLTCLKCSPSYSKQCIWM